MGFYHPSTLVKDAQRHGVTVLPIDVTQSNFDCTLEVVEVVSSPFAAPAPAQHSSVPLPGGREPALSLPKGRPHLLRPGEGHFRGANIWGAANSDELNCEPNNATGTIAAEPQSYNR